MALNVCPESLLGLMGKVVAAGGLIAGLCQSPKKRGCTRLHDLLWLPRTLFLSSSCATISSDIDTSSALSLKRYLAVGTGPDRLDSLGVMAVAKSGKALLGHPSSGVHGTLSAKHFAEIMDT